MIIPCYIYAGLLFAISTSINQFRSCLYDVVQETSVLKQETCKPNRGLEKKKTAILVLTSLLDGLNLKYFCKTIVYVVMKLQKNCN